LPNVAFDVSFIVAMVVDRKRLEDVMKQLPEELQDEVMQFAESLLEERSSHRADDNGAACVRSFFGIWDSGNPRSADNDQIDADLMSCL